MASIVENTNLATTRRQRCANTFPTSAKYMSKTGKRSWSYRKRYKTDPELRKLKIRRSPLNKRVLLLEPAREGRLELLELLGMSGCYTSLYHQASDLVKRPQPICRARFSLAYWSRRCPRRRPRQTAPTRCRCRSWRSSRCGFCAGASFAARARATPPCPLPLAPRPSPHLPPCPAPPPTGL